MAQQQATHLRCEYRVNPLGIDPPRPRLSWQLNDPRRGARQTAYQVVADGLWDSGKVESDQSVHVVYDGPALKSRQRVTWKVRTWDADGKPSDWSEPAWWEMGLLEKTDWTAQWIGSPIVGGPYSIPPAPYLRKPFTLEKPVKSARLYVTALGLYELEINGQRVGDYVFVPGRTEYTKRVPYHAFDVTGLLKTGANVAGAILGDGWYCGHIHSDPRMTFGDRPRLLAQLEVTFADGSKQCVVTDTSWKCGEGPIRSSDMLMGEDYDARMEIPGWSAPGEFDDSTWRSAIPFLDPGIALVAHRAPPVRRTQEIKPVKPPTVSANKRRHIFDMGQNIVGRVRLKVQGPPGKVIDLRYVEMLDANGKPYTAALRTARATDHYTTKGGAEEVYEPRFTFHGFRYVEVRNYPGGRPTVDDVTGIVVHSDTEPTGTFECSDPTINQLQSNIVWSQRGNFIDIPTDCPQRDERLGWTGDAQVFIRTAAFNMDVANFFTKWVQDVADAQFEDGHVPSVVPHVKSLHHEGGPAWADACVICPWTLWLCYGDTHVIEQRWPMMTRFMQWLQTNYPDHIRPAPSAKWKGYGDWLSINAETPNELIGTAFTAYCARLMSQMAGVLGKADEARHYERLFEDVRAAWAKRFVIPDGLLTAQTQTAYVLALHFDLVPADLHPRIAEALVRNIEARDMHLSTGFVGTPYLNDVLTRAGRSDVAYALLHQRTFPSWLYPITQGATTTWERWDAWTHDKGFSDTGMNSFNHYAFGAVGAWMYSTVAGIDIDPSRPGYKHVLIRPTPPPASSAVAGLTHARATLRSMYGPIESGWRIDGGKTLEVNVTIPPNTTATIRVPTADAASVTEGDTLASQAPGLRFVGTDEGSAVYEAGAGVYRFRSTLLP